MGSDSVTVVTDLSFEADVLGADRPVLLYFWATWCGPCKQLGPIVDAVADAQTDRMKVGKVDADREPIVTMHLGVTSLPTLVLLTRGKVAWKQVGVIERADLDHALVQHL